MDTTVKQCISKNTEYFEGCDKEFYRLQLDLIFLDGVAKLNECPSCITLIKHKYNIIQQMQIKRMY